MFACPWSVRPVPVGVARVEPESQSTTDAPPGEKHKHKHKYSHKWFAVLFCTCMVLNLPNLPFYPCNDSINKQQNSPPRKLSGELSPPSTSVWHRAACPFPRELQWSGITAPYLPACSEVAGGDMTNCIRPESGLRNSHSHAMGPCGYSMLLPGQRPLSS